MEVWPGWWFIGDKETIFQKVVERYMAGPGGYMRAALDQRAAAALAHTLHSAVEAAAGDHGCLVTQSALAVNPRSATVQKYLTGLRENGVMSLADRLQSFSNADGLPPGSDLSALARLLSPSSKDSPSRPLRVRRARSCARSPTR
ncbi:hypothetical protein ACFXPY_12950 [Streptomyces sp. NPDC059153]|uniref:hypothetical protein n=1 Tax=Streptomyces sp. NPDC059153 TaxID=3346743 RepID=UPI0036B08BDB